MYKKTAILIISLGILLAINGYGFADPAVVSIDASHNLGEMPELFQAGIFGYQGFSPGEYSVERITNDYKIGQIAIPIDWDYYETRNDFLMSLPFSKTTNWALNIEREHGEVIINIFKIPQWLQDPDIEDYAEYSPPGDLNEWAETIRLLVDFFNNQIGLDPIYLLWDEPDMTIPTPGVPLWTGTENEFFELYKYTVLGAKRADHNARIAGPGDSGLGSYFPGSQSPMAYNFIAYCSRTGLPEVGLSKLPIDDFVWHDFGLFSSSNAAQARQWLAEFDYQESSLTLGSWNSWAFLQNNESPERDTEYTSAYIIGNLYRMDESGIDKHMFFTIQDEIDTFPNPQFTGRFGLFTPSQIIKPSYNSFKALSILNGKREGETPLRLETSFDYMSFITAIASQNRDGSTIRVLISNYIPDRNVIGYLVRTFKSCVLATGYTEEQYNIITHLLKNSIDNNPFDVISVEYLQQIVDLTDFPADVEQDLDACILVMDEKYNELQYLAENQRQVILNLKNIPFSGEAVISTYTIDREHSNSCYYNKETEPFLTDTACGIDGAIDQAVAQAKNDAMSVGLDFLLANGYSQAQITELSNCLKNPVCRVSDLVESYCGLYPSACEKLKNDLNEAKILYKTLVYYGTYTASDGITYIIPVFIDKINNLKEVSLEGSKQEKQVIVSDGSYTETFTMQPYSVVLIELFHN